MASAKFLPSTVKDAARRRIEADKKEAEERHLKCVHGYMKRRPVTGCLWWKVIHVPTLEDAWHRHQRGYWPWNTIGSLGDTLDAALSETASGVDRWLRDVSARARRLYQLADAAQQQVHTNPVTLHDDEAAFLRLSKELSIDTN